MFSWVENNGVRYLKIDEFSELGVNAYFTSRIGGVSEGSYSSLNLALHTKDKKENVLINRMIIAEVLGINANDFVVAEQVHGNKVYIVNEIDKGAGARNHKNSISGVDAMITADKGIPLLSFYADCVPLFFYAADKKIIALAHAGWKGSINKIAQKTIIKMKERYDIDYNKLRVAIGPSISRDYYQVNDYVVDKLKVGFNNWREFIIDRGKGQYLLDLWQLNISLIEELCVPSRQIILSNYCSYKDNEYFYSYRKEKSKTGRMASIIYI